MRFDPYPFDTRPLTLQFLCKRLPNRSYADQESFTQAYFQAPEQLLEYELL